MATKAENQQKMAEHLHQLQGNLVFQEVLTQLMQLRQIKRKEQRSALQQCDRNAVFRVEAEISGIEEFFKVYEGQMKALDKLSEDSPTVFKY